MLFQEINFLLMKRVIKKVCPEQWTKWFYVHYFLFEKKKKKKRIMSDLDLGVLNKVLEHSLFQMIKQKQMLSQVHPGDWFVNVDLKDDFFFFFFNQIIPRHRHFIFRSTFGDKTNQFHVFLNGVSLAHNAWICGFYGFLNLRVNRERSSLTPCQGTSFLSLICI